MFVVSIPRFPAIFHFSVQAALARVAVVVGGFLTRGDPTLDSHQPLPYFVGPERSLVFCFFFGKSLSWASSLA
jgi:hypothetical protein